MLSSLRPSSLVLGLGLSLACSSAAREGEAVAEVQPSGPVVGAAAPALALDSLSGERVRLPNADGERATVLIFGSFS
jgi:hypothetical protein